MLDGFSKKLNDINSKISSLDKEARIVLNNVTGDVRSQLDNKTKELEMASDERKYTLERQISNLNSEIEFQTKKVETMYESKKEELYHEEFDLIIDYFNNKMQELSMSLSEKEHSLSKVKDQIKDVINNNDFSSLKVMSQAACDISDTIANDKNTLENIKKMISDVTTLKEMNNVSFEELNTKLKNYLGLLETSLLNNVLNSMSNVSKTVKDKQEEVAKTATNEESKVNNSPVNPKKQDDKPQADQEKEELAKAAVAKLENDMTRQNLNAAINEVVDLKDEELKAELKKRIKCCELEIKRSEEKAEKINLVLKRIDEFEIKQEMSILESARKILEEIEDSSEKRTLLNKIERLDFDYRLKEVEKKLDEKESITRNEVVSLTEDYNHLKPDLDEKYKERLNKVISIYNEEQEYSYQKDLAANEKPEKYGFFKKTCEFMAGWLVNPIINSKIWRKINTKLLEKNRSKLDDNEEDEKVENKIAKYEKRLNNSVIVNGFRLFVKKDKIASLSPKLYRDGIEDNKNHKALSAVDDNSVYVSNYMNKKLNKIAKDESIFSNKGMVKNMVMQYLDTLALGYNPSDFIYNVYDFLDEALTKKAISQSEYDAYLYEAHNIVNYREAYQLPCNVNYGDADEIVKHYEKGNTLNYVKGSK